MTCFKRSVRFWLQFFNIVEALLGGASTGYGIFLAVKAPSVFSYLVIATGALMILNAILGYAAVGGHSSCTLTLYSVLTCGLFAAHTAGVVFVFAKKQEAVDWINSHSGNSQQVSDAENFIEEHITVLAGITIGILVVEGLSFLIAVCARASVLKDAHEDWEDGEASMRLSTSQRDPLLTASGQTSATPVTDSQRARLNDKYGDVWAKKSSHVSSQRMMFVSDEDRV